MRLLTSRTLVRTVSSASDRGRRPWSHLPPPGRASIARARGEAGPGGGAHTPAGAGAGTRAEQGGAARGPGVSDVTPEHTSAGGRGANQ